MGLAHSTSSLMPGPTATLRPRREDSDAALIARLLRRDRAAWRTFHASYAPSMTATIRATAYRSRVEIGAADVEDVHATLLGGLVQNDMKKLRAFDPGRRVRLSTWLSVLARNATLDHLRKVRRSPRIASSAVLDELLSEQELPSDHLTQRERHEALPYWFEKLASKEQVFVELLIAGHTYREISERMGITLGTVYSKTHKLGERIRAFRDASEPATD